MKWPVAHSLNSTWFWLELVGNCRERLKITMECTNIQFCERLGHGWQFHTLVKPHGFHLRALSWEDLKVSISKTRLKFAFFKSHPDLPATNDLTYSGGTCLSDLSTATGNGLLPVQCQAITRMKDFTPGNTFFRNPNQNRKISIHKNTFQKVFCKWQPYSSNCYIIYTIVIIHTGL